LKTIDAYLDARFEVSQALADLAAAVGDLSYATGVCGDMQPEIAKSKP
jgi:hypothetical protein